MGLRPETEDNTRTGEVRSASSPRRANRDWGEGDEEDEAENDLSAERRFRILSAYRLADDTKIWIITEADRSVTTILLPDEY